MEFGVVDRLVVAFFALWAAATLRFHVPLADNLHLRRRDPFGLIPDWRFFAPEPGKLDYHLLYRDRLADGTVSDWKEVKVDSPRRWFGFVWNPFRRDRKGLFDIVGEIGRLARSDGPTAVKGSVAYLALLTYVSARPRLPGCVIVQFCIMVSDPLRPDQEPQLALLSEAHWL